MVIVDAKLELRDSTSWDTLDRAIKRVGGVAAAVVEGNGKGVPAAAAHAPDALSPRDSDDEDSTGATRHYLAHSAVCLLFRKLLAAGEI